MNGELPLKIQLFSEITLKIMDIRSYAPAVLILGAKDW